MFTPISVNYVSSCQVVLFWFLVSDMAIILFLKILLACDEKLMLGCCAARDTHFSAFIIELIESLAIRYVYLAFPEPYYVRSLLWYVNFILIILYLA